jgi:hypothetical protein
MPTERKPLNRGKRGRLSSDQHWDLMLGVQIGRPAFPDDEARRAAWEKHKGYLLALCNAPGQRPAAWWDYGCPILRPRYREDAAAALYEAGLLYSEEQAALLSQWRQEFDKAQRLGFIHVLGSGRFLKDAAARSAHYKWAGIPRSLLRDWRSERRRRTRTIRDLDEAASPPVSA